MRGACQAADLTLMIRATRGRSRRPNHMRSLFDNPKAMPSVDLRRLPGGFHSVVKQASFNIAFGSNFGGLGKPKSMPEFDFKAFFFDVIFEKKKTYIEIWSIFWRLETGKITSSFWKNNDFNKIRFFDKDPKNNEFFLPFSEAKAKKIPIKIYSKMYCF